MRVGILLILSVTFLAGCRATTHQTASAAQDAGPFPESYKAVVQTEMRRTYFDPYSLRDVAISTPVVGNLPFQSGAGSGWLVCVEANGKNKMGGYIGLKKDVFLIRNAAVVGGESERFVTEDICKSHTLLPWKPIFTG